MIARWRKPPVYRATIRPPPGDAPRTPRFTGAIAKTATVPQPQTAPRGPRRVPLQEPRPLRRLQRNRADRGVLRAAESPPLSRRGNRRVNHAIHMAAVTQVPQPHSEGRACYDKKLAEGKTHREALRSLKRQVSDAVFTLLREDARRAAGQA